MLSSKLISPQSILVVGGSNNLQKIGGKVLFNLISGSFEGNIYVLNPKADKVQGITSFSSPEKLSLLVSEISEEYKIDLAVLAIPAQYCEPTVSRLIELNITNNFIILSAGFSEESKQGRIWEESIAKKVEKSGGCLIGPNCIGVMNSNYQAVFTSPVPKLVQGACELISSSGSTAVFTMEAGIEKGLLFSSVYSVGNAPQTSVEDILEYLDNHFDVRKDATVKLLYLETIQKPQKLLKHASSLIRKGATIVAIKAGNSEAGIRAASSHTGALSKPVVAVEALFFKAGIISCDSRQEQTTIAKILTHKKNKGKNIAIITNAGGSAVMLTDVLTKNGLNVPEIKSEQKQKILEKLHPGASANNPIDLLATGNAEQLSEIIEICENEMPEIDAICIIFGSPGLFPLNNVFRVIDEKIQQCTKPIYPILPSILNVKDEIDKFISHKRVILDDEVVFGKALCKIANNEIPQLEKSEIQLDKNKIRTLINNCKSGYLPQEKAYELLQAADIKTVNRKIAVTKKEAVEIAKQIGFPVAMKIVGPLHKTDVKGVSLNISDILTVEKEFERIMKIEKAKSVEISEMLKGVEIFMGVKKEENFGHLLMCGLGGIFVEIVKDISTSIVPVGKEEAHKMIRNLKSYQLLKAYRGQKGIDESTIAENICKISALVKTVPEIAEMDINPLIGSGKKLTAVDVRIKLTVEKMNAKEKDKTKEGLLSLT